MPLLCRRQCRRDWFLRGWKVRVGWGAEKRVFEDTSLTPQARYTMAIPALCVPMDGTRWDAQRWDSFDRRPSTHLFFIF